MKPKIFIGSSREADRFAAAIHHQLRLVAECTVWTDGAFGLSEPVLQSLVAHLRQSDFGVFILAPDDISEIRGQLLVVARDNVLYEAGLFSGYLGPERCFMAIPESVRMHLPTDLSGLTLGVYEDERTDGNVIAAVSTFCNEIKDKINKLKFFEGTPSEKLRELCVSFACCEWITDKDERIKEKNELWLKISEYCKHFPLNKSRLLDKHHPGFYVALLCAIWLNPSPGDWKLITSMKHKMLFKGFSHYKLLDALERLRETKNLSKKSELDNVRAWLESIKGTNPEIDRRIEAL